ncbi:hypothetical protein OAB57_02695 [Bacteriovoracaceae bacterium]|nr:hypothetical protein [Bacteriovoracaceae bacterium]
MHSSISNSKKDIHHRVIPNKPWTKLAIFTIIGSLLLTLLWEIYWRNQGYLPTLNDNKDLWTINRELVDKDPKRTVLIGASRMLYDFNLDLWEKTYGETPIQLATVGTNPTIYLDDLANHSSFSGTLIIGITPPLFFVPEGMPVNTPTGNISHYRNFSPTQRLSHYLGLILDRNLAFIEQDDIPLKKILNELPIPNRKNMNSFKIPPYFMKIDDRRNASLYFRKGHEKEIVKTITSRWIPLFTPPPPPPQFTLEQFKKMFMEHMKKTISIAKTNIATIQKRGGKVVLIRFPSTGKVRELENKFAPRAGFWDQIVNVTQPDQAIHFEDHPNLANFECPEWSHLSSEDAKIFTSELISMIQLD